MQIADAFGRKSLFNLLQWPFPGDAAVALVFLHQRNKRRAGQTAQPEVWVMVATVTSKLVLLMDVESVCGNSARSSTNVLKTLRVVFIAVPPKHKNDEHLAPTSNSIR